MKDTTQIQGATLPHRSDRSFLLDGGLETTLIYYDGIELPYFAAFPLVESIEGRKTLRRYYSRYASIAASNHMGMILETPTWRASSDWGVLLGYDARALARANMQSVDLLQDLRNEVITPDFPILLSGCIGPRGDGYVVGSEMWADEAEAYHSAQMTALRVGGVEMVTALTMTYVNEAIGIARAAREAVVPAVISFTVETDGRLPSGQPLGEAIAQVDAETGASPIYYMINCAHPTHFEEALKNGEDWLSRIGGIRANASRLSHAELDAAEELDDGNPVEFGQQHVQIQAMVPSINVMGGCCGTDHRHIEAICHYSAHGVHGHDAAA